MLTQIRPHSQLEAIIRISESLAKLTLSPVVQNHHVEEAIRLFKQSTMSAVSAGSADGMTRGALNDEMLLLEEDIKHRLPVGWSCSYQALFNDYVSKKNFSAHAVERTLYVMEKREIIRFSGHVRGLSEILCLHKLLTQRYRKKLYTVPAFDAHCSCSHLLAFGVLLSMNASGLAVMLHIVFIASCTVESLPSGPGFYFKRSKHSQLSDYVVIYTVLYVNFNARLAQSDRASDSYECG